ncbi:ACS family tartrate transporter-like MFS transporter [Paraburkholderia bannensis]|uniref:Putative tartrate transporter n=1 Tax=Paraburkholderia bannensis TaxID=765414 RepID=A0A7W9U4H0_9BURK|nr:MULTISPECIES: MFS transporter [Paraburkholderia]MBB3261853.1 ACS family tartrate transporter-like MFS transporter [Paraburkholderia sp. WP4_3_2]MBB6106848.1 ACS family tartrate transporter-like MFS transporter [Paraburkholderia bannensis]
MDTDITGNTAADRSEIAARVTRKLMWRIIPFVMLLYFVSFLDRVNVGFAAITMNKAIGLSPAAFGLGGGLFFIGYFLFEIPSNLILHRVGARLWIARVMVSWGLVSAASAFVSGPASFYTLRFLLGVAEAGFFPGIILYLSLWFPARQRAVAAAWFMAAAPISTAIGSPLSGALMQLPPFMGLADWQLLYLIEAVPAVVLGVVVLRALTDSPDKARWLDADERNWLITQLRDEARLRESNTGHTAAAWSALRDPRVLALALIYFGTSAGLYTLGLWAPLMIREFGFSALQTGLLNAIPAVVAVVAMIVWARHSDRTGERTWHVVLPCLLACAGFVFAGSATSALAIVLALVTVNVGISAAKAPLWAMPGTFLSGAGAAAGIAMINSIGNLGGFVGPAAIGWLKAQTGGYTAGLQLVAATLALSAIVALLLSRKTRQPVLPQVRHDH